MNLAGPVAVTGASGFIGLTLVRRLAAAGTPVRGLARAERTARLVEEAGGEPVRGNLEDLAALRRLVEGSTAVVHAAGLVRALNRAELDLVNWGGTRNLLGVMAESAAAARLVHVSSLAAAGPSSIARPRTESDPPAPISHYGRSKRKAEIAVEESPLNWTVLRPSAVYGPGDRDFLVLFRITRFGLVLDPGPRRYSFVHSDDLVDALLVAAKHPAASRRTFFITGPEDAPLVDFSRIVARHLGRPARRIPLPDAVTWAIAGLGQAAAALSRRAPLLGLDKAREATAPSWRCTPALAGEVLGWVPRVGLDEGLAATCRWYRERGLL